MNNEQAEKKLKPWFEVVLIGFIIALLILILFFTLTSGHSKFQNLLSSSKFETKETEYDNIQMIIETSKSRSHTYRLIYPETNFDSLNKKINQYIDDAKESYLSKARENKDKSSHLNINFNIYPYNKKYYSIVFTKSVTYDFSNYSLERHTYFIDKNNGQIINLKKLIKDDISHFTVLSSYIQNDLLNSKELKGKIDKKTIVHYTNPVWENYNNFAIINNQLVMYFNMGETASKESIIPTVKIKMPYLEPILDKPYKSSMKSKVNILSDYNRKQSKNRKRVALTFDDGPHKTVTKEILNTLDQYNVKATFFVLGTQVKKNKEILKEIKQRGHEIGNHTMNHANLTKLKMKQVENEVNSANKVIKEVIGEESTVFRPPYGAINKNISKKIKVPVVLWSVDTLDWKHRDSKKLLKIVKKNVHNNAIILMHDIHQPTADGLDAVLEYLYKEGYEFVTVSELLSKK